MPLLKDDRRADLELGQLAYSAARAAVIARRNAFAEPFSQALLHWNGQTPGADGRLVPVEDVLDRVVGRRRSSSPAACRAVCLPKP